MGNFVELLVALMLAIGFGAAAFATLAMGQGLETQELVIQCNEGIKNIGYLIGSLL